MSANELSKSEPAKKLLKDIIEDLPSREKQIIRFKFWNNMDFYEIADDLEMRVSTVKKIFMSAMKKLKRSKNKILDEFKNKEDNNV